MIDIAIVGGGIAGLSLANGLVTEGRSPVVFEAADRLGGRILTHRDPETGLAIDMGPTWFWPETQSLVPALARRLGLTPVEQYDSGKVLALKDAEAGPESMGSDPIHDGAYRLAEGMGALVEGLAEALGQDRLRLGAELTGLSDRGDHVLLRFADGTEAPAKHVVLAMPPRLIAERIQFEPAIPLAPLEAMPTWMAAQAKAVVCYSESPWRADGYSGSAFVAHERAVLGEVFDLSADDGTPGALGGFMVLSEADRTNFGAGLPMLVVNQMSQLFGASLETGRPVIQDWATERLICAASDLTEAETRRVAPNPTLRRGHWGGRLRFCGTETARRDTGHVEGALAAAERVLRQMTFAETPSVPTSEDGFMGFAEWLETQNAPAYDAYRHHLTLRLSRQQAGFVTREAVLDSMEVFFGDALAKLDDLGFEPSELADGTAMRILGGMVKSFINGFIGQVVGFNRNSCALRAFPDEHEMPKAYLGVILADVSTLGGGFLAEADGILKSKRKAA